MKTKKYSYRILGPTAVLLTTLLTGCGVEDTGSMITSTDPANGATSVAINSKVIAYFSESIDQATIDAIDSVKFTVISDGEAPINGNIEDDSVSKSVSFKSNANFSINTEYTASITAEVNGVSSDYVWKFTSGDQLDEVPPEATSTYPSDGDELIPINRNISVLFNEKLDPSTIKSDSFKVTAGDSNAPVTGVVSYENSLAFFKPSGGLVPDTKYTATLTTAVADLAGNTLAPTEDPSDSALAGYVWSFTTGLLAAQSHDPVNLRAAEDFVILTKTGISTTGATDITGDLGVSPIALTAVTGFGVTRAGDHATSALVKGKIYAADLDVPTPAKMTVAIANMETAYTESAGRAPDHTELYAGEIGGKTLAPGTYKWPTNVWIYDDVTLMGTGTGGENDVWIFQVSGDVILASGKSVILAGGVQAKNVFWQVAGGAGVSLGTGSNFVGVVLSHKKIVVRTGVKVTGRLLSQTAVTLDANQVTQP